MPARQTMAIEVCNMIATWDYVTYNNASVKLYMDGLPYLPYIFDTVEDAKEYIINHDIWATII